MRSFPGVFFDWLLIALAVAGSLLLAALVAGSYFIASNITEAEDRLQSLAPSGIQLSVDDIADTEGYLWRQVYEVRGLKVADAQGGFAVSLPLVRVELDWLRSLLSLKLRIIGIQLPEPASAVLTVADLEPGEEPVDLELLLDRIAASGDYFRLDSLSVPALNLKIRDRSSDPWDSYRLHARFARSKDSATWSFAGIRSEQEVLSLKGRWRSGEDWLALLHVEDLSLQNPLAATLRGLGLELRSLALAGELEFVGGTGIVPEQVAGSLSLSKFSAAGVPWPISFHLTDLYLKSSARVDDSSLWIPSISGLVGDTPLLFEDLTLQTDTEHLYLNISRQRLDRLVDLVASLAPMPEDIARNIREFQITGELQEVNLHLPLESPENFSLSGRLMQAAAQATSNSWPGFSGIAGEIVATASGGSIRMRDIKEATLYLPDYFDRWYMSDVSGDLGWKIFADSVVINGRNLRMVVDDGELLGDIGVTLPLAPQDEPARLEALLRGNGIQAVNTWKYTPKLPELQGVKQYLKDSVQGGVATLEGFGIWADLRSGGDFSLHMQLGMEDGRMLYAPGWPELSRGKAAIEILQDEVFVLAESGIISGALVGPGEIHVGSGSERPDWVQISLSGDFVADPVQAMDFLLNSGLREFMEPALVDAWGSGTVRGRIKRGTILLPPEDTGAEAETQINMTAWFEDVRLSWSEWGIDVRHLNGEVTLDTLKNMSSSGLTGRIFDKRVDLVVGGEGPLGEAGSHSFIDFSGGFINADDLYFYVGDWNRFIRGSAAYQGRLLLPYGDGEVVLKVESDSTGMEVLAPLPAAKSSAETRPSTLLMRIPEGEDEPVRLQALSGEICTDLLYRSENLGGDLWLSDQSACEQSWSGPRSFTPLKIRGEVASLAIGEQVDFFSRMPLDTAQPGAFGGAHIEAHSMEAGGLSINTRTKIDVLPDSQGSLIELEGEQIRGSVYVPDAEDEPMEIVLDTLSLDRIEHLGAQGEHDGPQSIGTSNFYVGNMVYDGEQLGELRFRTIADEKAKTLSFILLPVRESVISVSTNPVAPDRLLQIDWDYGQQDQIALKGNFVVDGRASRLLELFQIPGLIKAGTLSVDVDLKWRGDLQQFELEDIDGDIGVQVLDTTIDLSAIPSLQTLLTVVSAFSIGDVLGSLVAFRFRQLSGNWFKEIWVQMQISEGSFQVQEMLAVSAASTIVARGNVRIPLKDIVETEVAEDVPRDSSPELDMNVQLRLPLARALPWYLAALGNLSGGVGLYVLNLLLGKPLERATVVNFHLGGTVENPVVASDTEAPSYQVLPVWMEDRSQVYDGSALE